jgi:hypothetical protein
MEVNRTNRIDERIDVRSERKDAKARDFREFTKSYTSIFFSQHNTRVPDEKRRQLRGQVAGIVQELHNLPELTDTDRGVLNISDAVAFLLEGR